MEQNGGPDGGWRPRLTALADAQSRYFYILGIAGVLYYAVYVGLETADTGAQVRLFNVEVSAALVLTTGPTVLAFVIQAVTGSMLALENAAWRMSVLEEVAFEREDTSPSAIELAFYTTDRSPAWVRALGLTVYPAYLTAFLIEGLWLTWVLFGGFDERFAEELSSFRWVMAVLGLVLLVGATPRVVMLWARKITHAAVVLRHAKAPVRVSRAMTVLADITDSLRGAGRKVESRVERGSFGLYVDDDCIARSRSLQGLAVRTREWVERQAAEPSE